MNIFLLISLLGSCFLATAFECPSLPRNDYRQTTFFCWDGSSTTSLSGCCYNRPCYFFCGECETRCLGWSVDVSTQANYKFEERSLIRTPDLHGADTACVNTFAISIRTKSNSCIKIWEQRGCSGRSLKLEGTSIGDIKEKGWFAITAVSGCDFTPPNSVPIRLFHSTFWVFGYSKDFTADAATCKYVGDDWNDKADKIIKTTKECVKLWEHRDCTGQSAFVCGADTFDLSDTKMTGKTYWNGQVSALSLADYEDKADRNILLYLNKSADFTLYEDKFHECCASGCGTCERFQLSSTGCMNFNFYKDTVSSVDTHGTCIQIWEYADCKGATSYLYPGTPHHDDLSALLVKGKWNADWDDRIASISGCARLVRHLLNI